MNKIILLLCIVMISNSCSRKMEYDFDQRPDAKIQLKIDEYKELLTSSTHGWIGYLYPSGGGGFTFKFKFNPDETVNMFAALNNDAANKSQTSIWSLRAPQNPSLYFDNYSYIHELSDPAITKYGGSASVGAGGDFEFTILEASADTIRLKGNFRGSDLMLVRAKSEQGDDYISKAYDFVQNKLGDIERFKYYYKKLVVQGKEYALTINTDKSTISFWKGSENSITQFTTEYATDIDGIILRNPFVDDNLSISSISNLEVDLINGKANLIINGLIDASILNIQDPIAIDPDAPINLFANYSKTYTFKDFVFDGVRNHFKLNEETNLQGAYFKQRYFINNYDVMYYDYLNASNASDRYISLMRGDISTPNIIKFGVFNMNGTSPGGNLATKINNIRSWIGDTNGFYVYKTGEGFYDLVSVSDSRRWIRLY